MHTNYNTDMDNPICWDSACRTDVGKVRLHNEDAYLAVPELGLWVVADGVGGHAAGDVASQMVVNSLRDLPDPSGIDDFIDKVADRLRNVNRELVKLSVDHYQDRVVASTVVALLIYGDTVAWLWVGDSRIFRFRDGELEQLTRDHTVAAQYLAESDPPARGPAHALTRAIGADWEVDVDVKTADARPGDGYILCTDGLYKELANDEIATIVGKLDSAANLAGELMQSALERRARDNITVGVVRLFGRC